MSFRYTTITTGGKTYLMLSKKEQITYAIIIYTFGFILGWLAHVSF